MNLTTTYIIGAAAIGAALLWASSQGGAQATGQAVGGAFVDMTDGVITGVVTGAASLVGIPETDRTECQKAIAEGRSWDASFACPAKDFLNYVWN